MWCWRRLLRISWYMKRSNIQPKRRLLSHVQNQMMKYFGHIARRGGNSLEKVIMQGCVEGRRKPGRPRTRWIDQIKSMVGCPIHELYNLVQDRQRWCDVVAVASCQSWQDRTNRPTDRLCLALSFEVFARSDSFCLITSHLKCNLLVKILFEKYTSCVQIKCLSP